MTKPKTTTTPTPTSKPATATSPSKAKATTTLGDLCRQYIHHMENEGKSAGTVSSYTAELKLACKHLGAETSATTITVEKVAIYFASDPVTKLRTGRPKAQPSIDKSRRVLRLALVWAAEKKLIKAAPIPVPVAKS